jgi:hypothetical protein
MTTVPERCISTINCDYSRTQTSFEIKCLDDCPKTCHPPDFDCLDPNEGQIFPRLPPTRKEDIPALFTCPPKPQESWVVLACLHISSSGRLIIDYGERIQILSTQALQELIMTKPCQEETEEEEMIHLTKTAKIATGSTNPSAWQQYNPPGNTGVYVDVDTSPAGFTKTPTYITALHGFSSHWATAGASSIYNATPTGFRIYIRWLDGQPLTPQRAQELGWHIQWIGIED